MKISGIYKIINKTNGKYYVGVAKNISTRWKNHIRCLRGDYHKNSHLQRSWNKYGESSFDFVVLKVLPENTIRKELLKEEQLWLDIAFKEREKTYNLTFIAGGGTLGGKESPNFGHRHTDESKRKMSAAKMGFKHTKEAKRKMSVSKSLNYSGVNHPFFGKHHSESTKLKLCKSWEFINPLGVKVEFQNLTAFCALNDLDTSTMCKVFHGKLQQYKKWKKV